MDFKRTRTWVRHALLSTPLYLCDVLGCALMCLIMSAPLFVHAETMYREPWGKDAELVSCEATHIPPLPEKKGRLTQLAEQVILFHQNVLSPIDGPRSHFRPTSSRYMLLAMRRYGFVKGFIMGCDRLLRENEDPWVYRTVNCEGVLFKWDPTY